MMAEKVNTQPRSETNLSQSTQATHVYHSNQINKLFRHKLMNIIHVYMVQKDRSSTALNLYETFHMIVCGPAGYVIIMHAYLNGKLINMLIIAGQDEGKMVIVWRGQCQIGNWERTRGKEESARDGEMNHPSKAAKEASKDVQL